MFAWILFSSSRDLDSVYPLRGRLEYKKMAYIPPIPEKDVKKAEDRFLSFAIISGLFFYFQIVSFFWGDSFWDGNILWGTGSFLVFNSVVSIRFFNIKKVASPDNRHFNKTDFRKWIANYRIIL